MIKTLIADDEWSCRETLRHYIQTYCPSLHVVAEADDVPKTVAAIRQYQPDLVFLDVEMPYGNAFDVLEQTREIPYKTIFATAYSEYALRALNSSASYYLLKPINISELKDAVQKISETENQTSKQIDVLRDNLSGGQLKKIMVPNLNGFEVLSLDEVICFTGNGNYTDVMMTEQRKKTVSRVLRHFEALLDTEGFWRVHKSHLVNLAKVQAWHRGKGGYLVMEDGSEVEVSPAKRDGLLKALESRLR